MKKVQLFALLLVFCIGHTHAKESDGLPFAKGDIFVAASLMDNSRDDHKGTGRILQFDKDLKPKGTFWIKSTDYQIGNLAFAPDGTLWAFSPMGWKIIEIGPDAAVKPARQIGGRSFGTVSFAGDGSFYLGEFLTGDKNSTPMNKTEFTWLEGRKVIGDGHVFHYGADNSLIKEYKTATHGGMAGIHGVTSMVLTDNGARLVYISETGNRLMQYDLAGNQQMPDLISGKSSGDAPMLLGLTQLADGRLIVSAGNQLMIADDTSGEVLKTIKMDNGGWAAIAPSVDPQHIVAGNFFTGEFVKLNLETGKAVARGDIGAKQSLAGIAQFPGIQ